MIPTTLKNVIVSLGWLRGTERLCGSKNGNFWLILSC
jgi:hypothetical protein